MAVDFNLGSVNSAAAAASVTNSALCCSSRRCCMAADVNLSSVNSARSAAIASLVGHERHTVLFVCGGVAWQVSSRQSARMDDESQDVLHHAVGRGVPPSAGRYGRDRLHGGRCHAVLPCGDAGIAVKSADEPEMRACARILSSRRRISHRRHRHRYRPRVEPDGGT